MKPTQRRLSIDIDEDLYNRFWNHVEWGMQRNLVTLMIHDFVEMMEKHGAGTVIGAFLARAITLKNIVKIDIGGDDGND